MTPQQVAERCAEILWADDQATRGLGMSIVSVGPGAATLTMAVRPDMVNGHGSCHGGFIFALADSAFAYAANSFNQRAVAAGADIDFLAPARLGELLSAAAHVRHQGGRSGVYDVEVTNPDGRLIAVFRGRAARVKGHFFEAGSPPDRQDARAE